MSSFALVEVSRLIHGHWGVSLGRRVKGLNKNIIFSFSCYYSTNGLFIWDKRVLKKKTTTYYWFLSGFWISYI